MTAKREMNHVPDYIGATIQAKERAEANAGTASSNRDWVFRNLDMIELALAGKDTYQSYLQWLNDEYNFGMSVSVFANYLSDARRARDNNPGPKRARHKVERSANPSPFLADKAISKATDSNKQDDWNETEKLIGYRLEDCIRPYVQVVDGKIERNFREGMIHTPDIRNALARLRNAVYDV